MIMNKGIALITGGSRGLGKNMALKLADAGIDVIITYKSAETEANEVVKQVVALGRRCAAISFDANATETIDGFVTALQNTLHEVFGADHFDYLINNAGMGATIPFLKATESDFDSFMNVHLKSVFFLTQRTLPLLNNGGRIINISSGTTRFCNPGYAIYASMKGAVETLTRYMAKELGSRDITVNVLAPGAIETDFNNAAVRSNPEMQARIAGLTALGRTGKPDDIGGIIVFLCSPESYWINGQRIEASGGVNL
ncbi:MAG: SDR family oxidoreductase [Ignavibacteria bacterium]|nr:SDR family oxidoreductase [Ignavibacteria bacterium]